MLGLPELLLLLMYASFGLVPLAVAIWAVVQLHHLRRTQDAMRVTLDRVEQTLSRR
jgi:hypothetical protein